jgi:type II secretory pathway component PulM
MALPIVDSLRGRFEALSTREQRTVTLGGAAALLVLFVAVLLPFEGRVGALQQRVAQKQADLAWLQSLGPQLAQLAMSPRVQNSGESLVALVDRAAREQNIAGQLAQSQPVGDGGLSVRFEQVPFDALAAWSASLVQRAGVHIVSASVESTAASGLVSASFVLRAR